MRYLAVLALFLLPQQDDAKIKQWIQQLDSSSLEEREAAYSELVKAGNAALPVLKKALDGSESAEVRTRVNDAILAIELTEKAKHVYVEPKRFSLTHDGPMRGALEEMAKLSGAKIEMNDVALDEKVALKLENVTLFEALDRLCEGREACTWEQREAGIVKMLKDKHIPYPVAHVGPFRLRVTSIEITRKTDFKTTTSEVNFIIDPEYDKLLKPMGRVKWEITSAADDAGRPVTVKPSLGDDGGFGVMGGAGGIRIMRAAIAGLGGGNEWTNSFSTTLGGDAKAIGSLKGTMTWRFPLAHKEVAFEDPTQGDTKEIGDFKVKLVKRNPKDGYTLQFTKGRDDNGGDGLAEELEKRFDPESVVAIDKDGKEMKAEAAMLQNDGMNIVVVNGQVQQKGGLNYRVTFADFKGREIKTLKFRFVDQTLEKKVDFELKGIKLP